MAKILFEPFNKEVVSDGGETLLELARTAGLPLQSTCGGRGVCGKCRVVFESRSGPPPTPTERETDLLEADLLAGGYRLACETIPAGNATVRVPEESRLGPQVVLTSGTDYLYPARLRPALENLHVVVPSPSFGRPRGDRERLLQALAETYGMKRLSADLRVLRRLPHLLRSRQGSVTATVWNRKEIVAVEAGVVDRLLGMAFDVGTTTVVGYLLDLTTGEELSVQSDLNPQIAFGDNVISRISLCQENPEAIERLRSAIVECMNGLIERAASEAQIEPGRIAEATVAGNTAMHHLLLGLDPRYLVVAPYLPALSEQQSFKARDLGLSLGASAYVHVLPNKAGFVGGDAVACVLAAGMHRKRAHALLIDLGTNGEIVLGNKERLICCSTAAGPAFEGGHIRWGMRAASGAIERIELDPETFEVKVKTVHNAPPVGLCGSGVISAAAQMIRAGVILCRGNFSDAVRSERLREGSDGLEFVLAWSGQGGVEEDIVLTSKDVSELQMAKAAVHAGAALLGEQFESAYPERVLLAGAGGNYVDPADALAIDLFPGASAGSITAVGNAAGYGACLALLDRRKRREAQRVAARMEYKELAGDPRFQELFVQSMFFTRALDYRSDF